MKHLNYSKRLKVLNSLQTAVRKVNKMNDKLIDKFPSPASVNQHYEPIENNYWTTAFYTGLQILCWQMTNEKVYAEIISKHLNSFKQRLDKCIVLNTHDLGFLYEYSSMAGYKFFGDKNARKDALEAADLLMERYNGKAGMIQAWGKIEDPMQRGRMIIDANMNLPLLYWASHETGNKKYYTAAHRHVLNAKKYILREDYSTYHTYYFDADTGEALRGATAQGFRDDSCWARGQAWAIYGFALNYDYTKNAELLEAAMMSADYFINHLPSDKVCYWDLIFSDGDEQEKDSSAAAIAACGLLELENLVKRKYPYKAEKYKKAATDIIISLIDNYSISDDSADGLIKHSVYNKPENKGVDECSIWGDYYYFEALMRLSNKYSPII